MKANFFGFLGGIIGGMIFAFLQSQQGLTDGSWDFMRIFGVALLGFLPGMLFGFHIFHNYIDRKNK